MLVGMGDVGAGAGTGTDTSSSAADGRTVAFFFVLDSVGTFSEDCCFRGRVGLEGRSAFAFTGVVDRGKVGGRTGGKAAAASTAALGRGGRDEGGVDGLDRAVEVAVVADLRSDRRVRVVELEELTSAVLREGVPAALLGFDEVLFLVDRPLLPDAVDSEAAEFEA